MAACALGITLCCFLYGFFLLEAVAHAARRASAERSVAEAVTRIALLQSEYLALTKGLTPESARWLGLVEPTSRSTVHSLSPISRLPVR